MIDAFVGMLQRDLLLAFRRRGEVLQPLLFFVIVVSLFPLGVGPEPNQLALIAPGVIWVAALLATMLSLDQLFRSDFDDGSLEQIVLSRQPLSVLVFAKVVVHWLTTGLPLLLLAPLLGVLMQMRAEDIGVMVLTLALGTPALSLLGAIAVALTVGVRRAGALVALLVLPLYVPVLIFGANAVEVASGGFSATPQFLILGAFLILALTLASVATAAVLRVMLA